MKIAIVSFGKLKTPGLEEAFAYYLKMLSPIGDVSRVELKPEEVKDESEATRDKIEALEWKKIHAQLKPGDYTIAIDERGPALSSQDWANRLKNWEREGATRLVFWIGSSLGLPREARKSAREKLSLGPQTLSHDLARAVLAEQLYRAWSIVRGHPYHKV